MESTLIYEAFSRGAKTFFCGFRFQNKFNISSDKFLWPKKIISKGEFWLNVFNEKEFKYKM